jgi:hypothetical protein
MWAAVRWRTGFWNRDWRSGFADSNPFLVGLQSLMVRWRRRNGRPGRVDLAPATRVLAIHSQLPNPS